jgi:hypothetical protein
MKTPFLLALICFLLATTSRPVSAAHTGANCKAPIVVSN